MNSREKREKLKKLAKLKDIHAEAMYYRCLDKSVAEIARILGNTYGREYEDSTISSRFTTIYQVLKIEEDKKEDQLVQEYSQIFLEYVKSEEDLKKWGHIRKEMLDRADELQPQGQRSLRPLLAVFLAISVLLLVFFVVFRFHTGVAGCAELSSLPLSDEARNDPFKKQVPGWIAIDDHDGYTMLKAQTSDHGIDDLYVGPPLLDGCIDYRFKVESYDKQKHDPHDDISIYGKVEINFRLLEKSPENPTERSYVLDFLPILGRAGLVYRNENKSKNINEWKDLSKGKSQTFGIDTGKWYYVTVDIQGDTIKVYLQKEGQKVSTEDLRRKPIISSQDSRISQEGIFSFYVGPYAIAYIDNVKIWDAR
jgi:hypothetical protein